MTTIDDVDELMDLQGRQEDKGDVRGIGLGFAWMCELIVDYRDKLRTFDGNRRYADHRLADRMLRVEHGLAHGAKHEFKRSSMLGMHVTIGADTEHRAIHGMNGIEVQRRYGQDAENAQRQ